jgi:hypothetical protein
VNRRLEIVGRGKWVPKERGANRRLVVVRGWCSCYESLKDKTERSKSLTHWVE